MILPLLAALNSLTSWLMASFPEPEFEYQKVISCSPEVAVALEFVYAPQPLRADSEIDAAMTRAAKRCLCISFFLSVIIIMLG